MKKLTEEQIIFLNRYCRRKWEQNEEGIAVYGNVNLYINILNKIPVKFYEVYGYFDCSHNKLINLDGVPKYVYGDFLCFDNNLTSLEGCPEYIGGNLFCYNNKLTSLEGIGEVKGSIFCYKNKIDYRKEKELRPEIYKKIEMKTLERMVVECRICDIMTYGTINTRTNRISK